MYYKADIRRCTWRSFSQSICSTLWLASDCLKAWTTYATPLAGPPARLRLIVTTTTERYVRLSAGLTSGYWKHKAQKDPVHLAVNTTRCPILQPTGFPWKRRMRLGMLYLPTIILMRTQEWPVKMPIAVEQCKKLNRTIPCVAAEWSSIDLRD